MTCYLNIPAAITMAGILFLSGCDSADLKDESGHDYMIATDSDKRYEMPEDAEPGSSYAMYRDFDNYLVNIAGELNGAREEGTPEVVFRASPKTSGILEDSTGTSSIGFLYAEVQVTFRGEPVNIDEYTRAMDAIGATKMYITNEMDNPDETREAMSKHIFYADYDDGRWVICPDIEALRARGISAKEAGKLEEFATRQVEELEEGEEL